MLAPGTPIGRYVVTRKLAEGGMAELYLAKATGPDGFAKDVVIKQIRTFLASDQGFVEMFKAEARLASRLNHANVVQIFDFGRHEDTYYLAMELVQGASLWEVRRRCRERQLRVPPVVAAEICAQVARGLHYAHSLTEKGQPLQLVHRDVTPHNVLLSFEGAVKLTDFGIAKAGASVTAPGMLKGKYAYMSPEQARGEPVDCRTDVFALGVVLWELLTGQRLFEGESDVAVLRAVQEAPIAAPSALNPAVPPELSEVVLQALQRDAASRLQTAQAFERALANFVLRTAKSAEDTNVGAFLRHLFSEELEALRVSELAQASASAAHTAVVAHDDARLAPPGEAPVPEQAPDGPTLTPEPTAAPPVAKTTQQPGIRPSKRLGPLLEPADAPDKRTEPMEALPRGAPTAHMPGIRPSKRLPEPPPPAPAVPPDEHGLETTFARPLPPAAPPRVEGQVLAAPADDISVTLEPGPSARSLRWIIATCIAAGVGAGAVYTVQSNGSHAEELPAVVVIPLPEKGAPSGLARGEGPTGEPRAEVAPAAAAVPGQPGDLIAAAPQPPSDSPPPAKLPSPPPTAAGLPVASPSPSPGAPTEGTPHPAPRSAGKLVITASPYATVFLRSKRFDEVQGRKEFVLPAGDYPLILQHPKHSESRTVTVSPGKVTEVTFQALPH